MNVGGSGGSTAANSTTPTRGTERSDRRDPTPASAQSQADFEFALRSKQPRQDSGKDDDRDEDRRDEPVDGAVTGLAAAFAGQPPALRPTTDEPAKTSPRSAELTPTGTRAAMEAALNANVAPGITEIGESDPAALWEASVREPNAIPVDVRVQRAEKGANETGPAWTVSVRAAGIGADTLVRHAPRLDERLRKHGAGFTHVRIEDDTPEAE